MKRTKLRRDIQWLLVAASFAVVCCLIFAGPSVLSQSATSSEVEFEAELTGAAINGVTPKGRAEFEIENVNDREFKTRVENVNLPAGTVLNVLVDGVNVGTITLPAPLVRAELILKTENGQTVPQINSRTRVVVATQGGVTVVAGSFGNIPPSPTPTPTPTPTVTPTPSPSPSPTGSPTATPTPTPTPTATPTPTPTATPTPTPTPTPNDEVRLEAKLAGAPIGGLTPRGEAKFKLENDDEDEGEDHSHSSEIERELEVEVENVNLPAGTVLNVLIDGVKIGELVLNAQMEAELKLETEDGQPVPNVILGSTVVITNAQGQTILSGVFNSTRHTSGSNDIDDTNFFCEQQYRDFLGREADDSGLAFWTNNISRCGSDPGCVQVMRVDTSAAFFLSIESQETGVMLYLFNKESFGTMPRRNSFLVDLQFTTQGLIVGAAGWQRTLEENKRRMADAWVARPEFIQRFGSLSDDQFVDALFRNAGVQPTQLERNDLIDGLRQHRETRATVLRRVSDNAAFKQNERNSAFVLMQYFGYLHRNPDEGADHDMSGFNFWRRKLDDAGGDFRRAEMVRAFIESNEYRQRFVW